MTPPTKPGARILVVEDDANIRRGLLDGLELEGYTVQAAADGREARRMLAQCPPDLVLLDVMIPHVSGYDLCRELRKAGDATPVIMLTAKGQEVDRVVGLELGADDYVAKPFSFRELVLRIEAVLRRTRGDAAGAVPNELGLGAHRVDLVGYVVQGPDGATPLTPKEVELLRFMARHAGEALDRRVLLSEVWGYGYLGTTRTLDQTVARLRKKIEADPAEPRYLLTVHGIGYRLVV